MSNDVAVARRIADRRHAAEERAAQHLIAKFGLPADLAEDLVREVGCGHAKLDAAVRRLTDS